MSHVVETPDAHKGSIVVRASATSEWPDCKKRTFVRSYPKLVVGAGFKLRERLTHVGAAVGTGLHVGAQWLHKNYDQRSIADQVAFEAFKIEAAPGLMFDATTPRVADAQTQLQRLVAMYTKDVHPHLAGAVVEKRLWHNFGNGLSLTGQPDACPPDEGVDLKSGAVARSYIHQMGSYGLLRRFNGYIVRKLTEIRIPRTPVKSGQKNPVITHYDPEHAMVVASTVIDDIDYTVSQFRETGNPNLIPSNPSSMLCSDRYCPAWGTQFCREHKGAL